MQVIYREHREWALRAARRVIGSTHDAEDVVSEVFAATFRALQRGAGPRDNVRAYLKRAIQNEATKVYARRSVELVTDQVPETPIEDSTEAIGRSLARAAALRDCPPNWPLLLFHVDVCGLSAKEAGVVLNMTEYAAVSALYRARTALRLAA